MKNNRFLAVSFVIIAALLFAAGCNKTAEPVETIIKYEIIKASPETIWKYLFVDAKKEKEDHVILEWMPEVKLKNFNGDWGAGRTLEDIDVYGGKEYHAQAVITEIIPNQKYSASFSGHIVQSLSYILAPYEDGTKLVFLAEGVSGKPEIKNELARRMETALATIKGKAEKMPQAAAAADSIVLSDSFVESILIDAPVEKVFSFMTDGKNYAKWGPVQVLSGQGDGLGSTSRWKSELLGRTYYSNSVVVQHVPNQKEVNYFTGDVNGVTSMLWIPEDGKTRVIYDSSYSGEIPLGNKKDIEKIVRTVRQTHEQSLKKAKAAIEG